MRTFIVDLWAAIFVGLSWISVFKLITIVFKRTKRSYLFVEIWVLGHLVLAAVGVAFSSPYGISFWQTLLLVLGGIRVLETVVYQVNVLLFDEYRAKKAGRRYAVRGFRRIVILLLHNYAEIILWYAMFYRSFNNSFECGFTKLHTPLQAIGFSFNAMTTFGYASTQPTSWLGSALLFSQSTIGVFMAIVILARFISLLPVPGTLDEFEKGELPTEERPTSASGGELPATRPSARNTR